MYEPLVALMNMKIPVQTHYSLTIKFTMENKGFHYTLDILRLSLDYTFSGQK